MADNTPKWFKLFLRHKPMFDAAPAESVGIAMKALLAFFEDETERVPDEAFAAMLYAALIPDAKEAIEEYRRVCERNSRNGRKGGRPSKNRLEPSWFKSNPVGSTGFDTNPNQTEGEPDQEPKPETKQTTTLIEGEKREEEAEKTPWGFAPPTLSELEEYCSENELYMDCQQFLYYYEARGWKLSKGSPMTDWKFAARSWARRELNPSINPNASPEGNPYYVEGAIML